MKESLQEELKSEYESVKEFSVEYHESAGSSLDLRLFVKSEGKLASRKMFLERRIQFY